MLLQVTQKLIIKNFDICLALKARMPSSNKVLEQSGRAFDIVCPFGLANDLDIYPDIILKRFEQIFPASVGINSAIELSCDELFEYSFAKKWVGV